MNVAPDHEAEHDFIETLRPRFENLGYQFHIHPNKNDLPDFMGKYEPDAIALKENHNVAIEVKSRATRATDFSLRMIRHLFEGQSDWQLRVYLKGRGMSDSVDIPTSPTDLLVTKFGRVRDLLSKGESQAAFILAWSLLEAAARMSETDLGRRPNPPETVVQALAMSGSIGASDERRLRGLIDLRNRVIHGDLAAEPEIDDVEAILSTAEDTFAKRNGSIAD